METAVKSERMIGATSPSTILLGSFVDPGGKWSIAGLGGAGNSLVALME